MQKKPTTTQENIDLINSFNQKTDRLSLKKFTKNEVENNVAHEMQPELMRYIRDLRSIEVTRKKTLEATGDWSGEEQQWSLIAVRMLETNDYMGLVCFRYESIENDTVEIGWRLGSEFHGKGYATEAAQCLVDFITSKIKPHKIMAYCVAENTPSSNIMLKLGMQKEAHLREFCKLGGEWCDEAIYGLILN